MPVAMSIIYIIYYSHNLTAEEKEQFANFEEWHENANDEQKEEYDEFEDDYINYSHLNGGHDNLYLFSIVWKVRHEKDGVFIDIGDDVRSYINYPQLDDKTKHTIQVDIDNLEGIQEQLKRLF